jgi:hypothetical protein
MPPPPNLGVIGAVAHDTRIISQVAVPDVAVFAEQTPQQSGDVTVIDAERLLELALAGGTGAALPAKHDVVVLERQAVEPPQIALAPLPPVSGEQLRPIVRVGRIPVAPRFVERVAVGRVPLMVLGKPLGAIDRILGISLAFSFSGHGQPMVTPPRAVGAGDKSHAARSDVTGTAGLGQLGWRGVFQRAGRRALSRAGATADPGLIRRSGGNQATRAYFRMMPNHTRFALHVKHKM